MSLMKLYENPTTLPEYALREGSRTKSGGGGGDTYCPIFLPPQASSYLASLGLYLGSNETKLGTVYLDTARIPGKQEGNTVFAGV